MATRKKPVPKTPKKKMELKFNFNLKKLLVWGLILLLFLPFLVSLFDPTAFLEEISISQAISDVKEEKVEEIKLQGDKLVLDYGEDKIRVSRKEEGVSMVEILQREGVDPSRVNIEVGSQMLGEVVSSLLINILPIIGFGVILYFMMRQARGAQSSLFGFGKSKAKLFSKGKQDVTFDDVAGVDEAKKEMEEVVDFLKHPKKYKKVGARTPKGVLLVGPSGVGKTLLARAVAGQADVPFFSMAGSEFMEMLVGVGASRVRDLFETAKKSGPSIIFIDELDAIGRKRGVGSMGGHDEREQTLNQILVEMDGFTPNDQVVIIAATNRPDVLDPALVRPGRFDRRITLDLPDIKGREAILKIHAKGKPFVKEVKWEIVAKRTVGFSGADLENMLNEAAIQAARHGKGKIEMDDISEAALRVKLGPEKRRLQSEYERKLTAYHEGGHAVVGHMLPGADPVHRVSIVSRMRSLGQTLAMPDRDKYQQTKSELVDQLAMVMGGRAAEKLVFDEMTVGAANDIEKATKLARKMVVDWGMSKLGPVALGPMWETTEWGRSYMEPVQTSEEMKGKVDKEIGKLVDEALEKATEVLRENRKRLDELVEVLLEKETVEVEEFKEVMGVEKAKKGQEV